MPEASSVVIWPNFDNSSNVEAKIILNNYPFSLSLAKDYFTLHFLAVDRHISDRLVYRHVTHTHKNLKKKNDSWVWVSNLNSNSKFFVSSAMIFLSTYLCNSCSYYLNNVIFTKNNGKFCFMLIIIMSMCKRTF